MLRGNVVLQCTNGDPNIHIILGYISCKLFNAATYLSTPAFFESSYQDHQNLLSQHGQNVMIALNFLIWIRTKKHIILCMRMLVHHYKFKCTITPIKDETF